MPSTTDTIRTQPSDNQVDTTSTMNNAMDLETYILEILKESTELTNSTPYINPATTPSEVAMAKLLNYTVRMLHSNDWQPRTVVRAIVYMENESVAERTVKSFLYQAMRERKAEDRAHRAAGRYNKNKASSGKALNGNDRVEATTNAITNTEAGGNGSDNKRGGPVHESVHTAKLTSSGKNGDAGSGDKNRSVSGGSGGSNSTGVGAGVVLPEPKQDGNSDKQAPGQAKSKVELK